MIDQSDYRQTVLDLPVESDLLLGGDEMNLTGRSIWPRALFRPAVGQSVSLSRWVLALVGLDLLVALVASAAGFEIRFGTGADAAVSGVPYWLLAVVLAPVWISVLAAGGAYDRRFLASGSEEYRKVLNCGVWVTGMVAFLVFVLHLDLSREFVALTFPLLVALTGVERYAVRHALHRQVAGGRPIYRTVIVGNYEAVNDLRKHMERVPWAGFSVVASVTVDSGHVDVDELVEAVRGARGDTIAVAGRGVFKNGLRALSWRLEGTGIQLVVAPAVTDIAGPRIVVRPIEGLPLLMVEDPQMKGGRRLLKEMLDRSFALLALVAFSPVLIVLAVLIKLTSRGPVLYFQERVGLHGEYFRIWKLRTMRVGADKELLGFAHLNHSDGLHFKIRQDPRVTRVGRWIRRHSLDEVPQFWNVLRGQMSLVGPRPPLPQEVEKYGVDVRRRLLVKPGMTGLWQVSGRAELPWEETVRLDLFYVENWSVVMDMMVLWKTLAVVVHGRGAY